MIIREERPEDIPAIHQVEAAAFGRPQEADLVDQLRRAGAVTLSLVACDGDAIVGHILFSPMTVDDGGTTWEAVGLAPLAVLPERQNQGIGAQLVLAGFDCLRDAGHRVVIVLGHPDYYPRFGFAPARPLGIRWENEAPDEVFMVAELIPGALAGRGGVARYRPEFNGV